MSYALPSLGSHTTIGKPLLEKVSGFASIEEDAPPIDMNSIFRLASSTKIFTSILTLQCVERGQIGLDNTVYKYLPELENQPIISPNRGEDENNEHEQFKYTPATGKITLRRHTHTSGVGYDILEPSLQAWRKSWGELPAAISGNAIAAFDMPLLFEPEERWRYSAGHDAAGIFISRLNGNIPLEDYMVENIFKPLGCNSSTFFIKEPELSGSSCSVSQEP
jgi:CubicO group peptidase (beta-lactamase class C family)